LDWGKKRQGAGSRERGAGGKGDSGGKEPINPSTKSKI